MQTRGVALAWSVGAGIVWVGLSTGAPLPDDHHALGATDDDGARVSLSGIRRCGGADRVIAGRLFIGGLQRSEAASL